MIQNPPSKFGFLKGLCAGLGSVVFANFFVLPWVFPTLQGGEKQLIGGVLTGVFVYIILMVFRRFEKGAAK